MGPNGYALKWCHLFIYPFLAGPSIGALAGVIVADILILSVVIDSYLCHFVDRGFLYYFLGRYYHGKGKKENSKFYQ